MPGPGLPRPPGDLLDVGPHRQAALAGDGDVLVRPAAFSVLPLGAVAGVITDADPGGGACRALARAGIRLLPA